MRSDSFISVLSSCWKKTIAAVAVVAAVFVLPAPLAADEGGLEKKVLIIGIDGCRIDALRAAETPHLDSLIREGAIADTTMIVSPRPTGADTVSGPGWSSILTGVWADKHGVRENKFEGKNYEQFPHFFSRLKQVRPAAVTVSIVDWPEIAVHIVADADVSLLHMPDGKDYRNSDALVARDAARALSEKNPTAMFVYFGQIDETGHALGFHPTVKEYRGAIEQVDRHVGEVLAALRARPGYAREDWLVLATTDHGGQGTGHGGGHQTREVYTSFLIASGRSVRKGDIPEQTYLVDVPATALAHLGVAAPAAWGLDGKTVGLQRASDAE